ncbi:hypothetical protein N7U66_01880 [Lacinutrix neustonica]|uniref:Uncharacterized protein n=1 Tax=Lacinutrix neustonica TaxID=2980107 RepID=A0A9E8MX14_9FLAO|nr:hypothetical protein [Lacinutrix neustonica]WAC02485.1 hypothetical protein N7U66_01880 [Lacinutrix neustonica]
MFYKHQVKPNEKGLVYTALVLISFNALAQEKEQQFVVSGYLKNLNEFSFMDRLDQLQWTTFLHNRLNFKYMPLEEISVRLEFRNRLFYGDNVKNIFGFSNFISQDLGPVDLSWNLIDDGSLLLNTTIDRALINYTSGNWDITLGRQRINWGMNLAWNPNDIFNTYNLLDFDYEERPGSDALRVQYYLGDFNKIEVAVKKGSAKNNHIVAALYKCNTGSYDIQLITGVYQKDWILGAGWAGNLNNAGFKGEVTYFVPYERYFNSKNTLSTSLSVDYGFKKGLYINGSILYISGHNEASNTLGTLVYTNLNAKNLMPFEFSGFLQCAKEFTPLFKGTFSTIYSPTNQSVIIIPSLGYSIATNWELDFTGQSFFQFEEYKPLGNSFFARLRWSF